MQALDVCATRQTLGNLLPVLAVELLHCLRELFVFLWRPMALIGPVLVLCRASLVYVRVLSLPSADLSLRPTIVLFTEGRRRPKQVDSPLYNRIWSLILSSHLHDCVCHI